MKELNIREPALLIRIAELYRPNISDEELYEATRGVWRLGERKSRVNFAFSVAEGRVLEVFVIYGWHPGGSTLYQTRPHKDVNINGRWEFVGVRASDDLRGQYVGGSVRHYWKQGASNPVLYVNA